MTLSSLGRWAAAAWLLLSLTAVAQSPDQSPTATPARTGNAASANAAQNPAEDPVIAPPPGAENGGDAASIAGDPLLNPPPLPKGKVTMIGGVVGKIDPIRSRLTVQPFGSKESLKVAYDERTHIYRDGRETTYA